MLLYLLIALFGAVCGVVAWRLVARRAAIRKADDAYVCPVCDAHHCDCYKRDD